MGLRRLEARKERLRLGIMRDGKVFRCIARRWLSVWRSICSV